MTGNHETWLTFDRTNTILYCRHWAETVHYYRSRLNLPVAFENDWFVEFRLSDNTYLSIANSRRATVRAVHGQGITLTFRVSDVDAVQAELLQRGIETTPIRRRWGALAFYCHDPEGHRLEFWQDLSH